MSEFGDAFGAFAGGFAPHLARIGEQQEQDRQRKEALARHDREATILELEKSNDLERRSLAVALRMDDARDVGKGGKGKKSLWDAFRKGDPDLWRAHPSFKHIYEQIYPLIEGGKELRGASDMQFAGGSAPPPSPSQLQDFQDYSRLSGEAPPAPPGPGANREAMALQVGGAPVLAQPDFNSPTSGNGSMNPMVAASATPGPSAPAGPPPPPPGAAGIPRSILSPGQPTRGAEFRSDPYARTISQGFTPDILGNLGPMGEATFKAELGGQVTERQQFAEQQKFEREREKSRAASERLSTGHQNRIAEILERGRLKSLENDILEQGRTKRAGMKGKGRARQVSPTFAAQQRLNITSQKENDIDQLNQEERRAIESRKKERLITPEELSRGLDDIRRDFANARQELEARTATRVAQLEVLMAEVEGRAGGERADSPPPGPAGGPPRLGAQSAGALYEWPRGSNKGVPWDQLPPEAQQAYRQKRKGP